MLADPSPAKTRRRRRGPIAGYLPRAILNAAMALAVIVLERRIRKALRPRPDARHERE